MKNITAFEKPPAHIAIIMDGNGRWATDRALPRSAGHTAGSQNFRKIARYADKIGIKHLTLYVFSTENWSRQKQEVDALMKLFESYLKEAISDFAKDNIIVNFLGDRTPFSDKLQKLMVGVEDLNQGKNGMRLNLAMNYGGKAEIINAARLLADEVKNGKLLPKDIDEQEFDRHLYTAGQPPVDLLIRTGGDMRISNFLLWQIAYAEIVVNKKYWPDFTEKDLDAAIEEYEKRDRRFGGIK
ncbi:MAG TPA: polyprenyl diphosphate synthase [Oscillospiraceae bacterium]|nr:polyprenyl diphosphate synthase [Oscillospiraceae bacterium]HPF56362.1 polyprenyl diphosphate synthase [Clostridiales bacterium]HPK34288.1 polyprenyl diphosphate synthase [Oscillospiraceae bacterium]HPR74809.1 polyprenyl diphosphate synthase [Oscillospiraceae bacterium]